MNKSWKILTVVVTMVVIALCAVFLGNTASFRRGMKDIASEYGGGLNRTLTAYSATGEKIGEWKGKIDVELSENKVKFDLNGKRTIIYNCIVIVQED